MQLVLNVAFQHEFVWEKMSYQVRKYGGKSPESV